MNDPRIRDGYVTAGDVGIWRQGSAASTRVHSCPAWKLLACAEGLVEVEWVGGVVRSPSVLVPAGLHHAAAADAAFVALFVDALAVSGSEALPSRPVGLGTRRAIQWVQAGGGTAATGELTPVTVAVEATLGPPRADPLAAALRRQPATTTPQRVAADVGWSVGHLRDVLRAEGLPTLGQLLRWARIRTAVAGLSQEPPALVAAASGFSDQAHLTRVAAATVGRTPGSLRQVSTAGSRGKWP